VFDEIEKSPDVTYVPGGSVTNSIRVTNWCLKGSKHFRCKLLGCVGNDSYASKLKSELDQVGVVSLLETNNDHPTSRCAAAIFKKERCLVPHIMASRHLTQEFVNKSKDNLKDVELFFIEGYFLIEGHHIVVDLIKLFADTKKKIGFTLYATFMLKNFYDKMKEIAGEADLIFCNEDEAEAFANASTKNVEENSLLIHGLLKPREGRLLIVTCGSHPVTISKYDYKNKQLEFIIKQYVPKVPSDDIVDTNGCGDSFVGGFLSQYIQGKDLVTCAKAGNAASSVVIKQVGCTYPSDCPLEF